MRRLRDIWLAGGLFIITLVVAEVMEWNRPVLCALAVSPVLLAILLESGQVHRDLERMPVLFKPYGRRSCPGNASALTRTAQRAESGGGCLQ